MNTAQIKKKLNEAINKRAQKFFKTKKFKRLLEDAQKLLDSPKFYSIDEAGDLVSESLFEIPEEFLKDETGIFCPDLIFKVTRELEDALGCYIRSERDGQKHPGEVILKQCFGEPCLINFPPERDCYAVFCRDLKLKVDRIQSERHGLALAERAIRENGYFPDVGSMDYYGGFKHLSIPEDIREASDQTLDAMIEDFESDLKKE